MIHIECCNYSPCSDWSRTDGLITEVKCHTGLSRTAAAAPWQNVCRPSQPPSYQIFTSATYMNFLPQMRPVSLSLLTPWYSCFFWSLVISREITNAEISHVAFSVLFFGWLSLRKLALELIWLRNAQRMLGETIRYKSISNEGKQ